MATNTANALKVGLFRGCRYRQLTATNGNPGPFSRQPATRSTATNGNRSQVNPLKAALRPVGAALLLFGGLFPPGHLAENSADLIGLHALHAAAVLSEALLPDLGHTYPVTAHGALAGAKVI